MNDTHLRTSIQFASYNESHALRALSVFWSHFQSSIITPRYSSLINYYHTTVLLIKADLCARQAGYSLAVNISFKVLEEC